jgi:pilus assembly protein CpaE
MPKAQVMATSQEASNVLQIPSPIEKAAALPTGRLPLVAFVADAKTEAALRECLPQSPETPHVVMRGGIAKAIQHLAGERSPLTLIVDLSGVDLPVARIHDLADVCEPRVTVIALGDHNDVELYRDLIQAGVSDYLVKPITRQRLAKALAAKSGVGDSSPINQKLGKVVALIGARGGVGTTTLAANLAWYLANEQKRRVGLVDLDLQNGDCALTLDIKPTGGLREALTNPHRVDGVFLERAMAIHGERLFVLGCEEPLRDNVEFTADAVEKVVSVMRTQFHCVILDVPRVPSEAYRKALELADLRIIVADQTLRAARDGLRLRTVLEENDHEHLNLLVVNRAGEGGRHAVTLKQLQEVLGISPKVVIAYQPKLFAKAAGGARMPAAGRGALADGLAALALEIVGRPADRRGWWRFSK